MSAVAPGFPSVRPSGLRTHQGERPHRAVLAGSVYAATNFLANGGFEGGTPFSDWDTVTNVQARTLGTNQVAEVSTSSAAPGLGTLVSKSFNPGRSSVVMRLSGIFTRSPELNTGSATPATGENQAAIQVKRIDFGGEFHIAFLVHSQERFGTVSEQSPGWRSFSLLYRTNGGPNRIKILGVASPNPQGPAGRGILLDNLKLEVVSN
jgi:hypothetical protein